MLRVDRAAVRAEANLDGKFLLRKPLRPAVARQTGIITTSKSTITALPVFARDTPVAAVSPKTEGARKGGSVGLR
jgi:hypothetical protein